MTCGSAAGYYARTLMVRHKYSEALTVLKDIIDKKYGTYRLMDNYGDNFREGTAYENNDESLFEVQYLDYGNQGPDDEWTPVIRSPMPAKVQLSKVTSVRVNMEVGQILLLLPGCISSSNKNVLLKASLTHVLLDYRYL